MKNRWLTYGTQFCAIEHAIVGQLHLLQLEKKKKELVIAKQESYTDFDKLTTELKNQKHIFLIVNNEQVLSKEIDFVHPSDERVVKTAFPNIQLQDFYFEVYQKANLSMVAICRKEVVDTLLQEYLGKGISVINFSLGNIRVSSLLPFFEGDVIMTSNALVHLEDTQISSVEKGKETQKEYEINGLNIHPNQTLALGGVISYYSGEDNLAEDEFQNSLLKDYKQKRFFNLGLRFSLGFLFLSLLINFLLFTSYRDQVSSLTSELILNDTYKKQLVTLNELVSKKRRLVESMNSASNSKVVWYIDEITKSVPKTLLLDEINFQPLTRSIREDKQVVFKENQIMVKGISNDDTDFTQWIQELEGFSWVDKVSSLNYGSGKKKKTSFDFIIQMKKEE